MQDANRRSGMRYISREEDSEGTNKGGDTQGAVDCPIFFSRGVLKLSEDSSTECKRGEEDLHEGVRKSEGANQEEFSERDCESKQDSFYQ